MKNNYLPGPKVKSATIVSRAEGGTGVDNLELARSNLGLVHRDTIGKPLGLVPIDPITGTIPESFFDGMVSSTVTLDGPRSLNIEETGVYTITNFDSRVGIVVRAEHGTVTYSASDQTIIYKAPHLSTVNAGFFVNNVFYQVAVNSFSRVPNKPVITVPAVNQTANRAVQTFTVSGWSSNYPEDRLFASEWEASLFPNFSAPLPPTYSTLKSGLTFTVSGIQPGAVVYVRVRHQGYYGYFSEWSNVRSFTRPTERKPDRPTVILPALDGTTNEEIIQLQLSAFVGYDYQDVHKETEWQISESEVFANAQSIVVSTGDLTKHSFMAFRNKVYFIRGRYKNTADWVSDWSPVRVVTYTAVEPPERPTIIIPLVNTTVTSSTVNLEASPFVSPGQDSFLAAEWERSTNPAFSSDVVRRSVTTPDYMRMTFNDLLSGVTYYFRVRYRGNQGWYSDWSQARVVTYAAVTKPEIFNPVNGADRRPVDMTFTTSDFHIAGLQTTHLSSDWQLSKSANFDLVERHSMDSTFSKVSWSVTGLEFGTTYYLRVRHRAANGMVSAWSNITMFTTRTSMWSPVKIAEIPLSTSGLSVSASVDGNIFAVERNVYRMDPQGPTRIKEFTKAEIFGVAESLVTEGAVVSYVPVVSQDGLTVTMVASAHLRESTTGQPKALLVEAKFVFDQGVLTLSEHNVTGNPIVQMTQNSSNEFVLNPAYRILNTENHAGLGNVRFNYVATNAPTTVYTGRLVTQSKPEFSVIPDTDTHSLVEVPESLQMVTVAMEKVSTSQPGRHYVPAGYFQINGNALAEFYQSVGGQPLFTTVREASAIGGSITQQGQWLKADLSLYMSIQGNRLFIYQN